jgi:hypothetical protein
MANESTSAPTGLARRYVRYVSGFGVGIAVGVAPFLGKIKVPGFDALLSLFPIQLRNVLIPLSAFLMGLVAVAIQFYARERLVRAGLRRWFRWGFIAIVSGLLTFLVLYVAFVRVVVTDQSFAAVVVAAERSAGCGCDPKASDEECIQRISLNPLALASCWSGASLRLRELLLMITYLILTGGFGALIGLLMLQEESRRSTGSKKRSSTPRPTPPGHP